MNNDNLNPIQGENTTETPAPAETYTDTSAQPEVTVPAEVVSPLQEEVKESAPLEESADDVITPEKAQEKDAFEESSTPAEAVEPVAENTTPQPAHTPPVYAPPAPPAPYKAPPYQAPYSQPAKAPVPDSAVASTPPAPPKKKGHVVFLACLFTLIGIFAIGFFVLCGYVAGQNSGFLDLTKPTFFAENDEEETQPLTDSVQEDTPEGIIPLPEKDEDEYSSDGSIDLKSLPRDNSDKDKYTTQYAYKKVAESTIGVVCYEKGFTGEPASQGTGIVITNDGYIATNSHVIGDSRTAYNVQVVTNDGTTYEAKVVGFDSRTDLAVLKVNARNLTPAEFCDSDLVEVGIDVIAVGNPGGMDFQNSLTRGVVSALNRELGLSAQVSYIQTDAAINPGNSGGPLSNMYGQVIGITTAKISSESVEGMGFAIPSRTVKEIVDDLMTQGYVSNRVRIGISGQAVSSAMQQYYNLPGGILVGTIAEDGPCYNTELKVNDIITKIDDEEVADFSDVFAILGEHKPGDKVVLTVYRRDTQKTFEVTITLMADEGHTQQ